MKRAIPALAWVLLAPITLCAATLVLRPQEWRPHSQADLQTITIYAYRQWQSTGIDVAQGDQVSIRASGEWEYSPLVGLHGPEGGGRPSPPQYPLSRVPGGALLGRIGDDGPIFYVGRGAVWPVQAPGRLYLRINDDLLGDNAGQLAVTVDVIPAPTAEPNR